MESECLLGVLDGLLSLFVLLVGMVVVVLDMCSWICGLEGMCISWLRGSECLDM
jgi:hypothetical protein